MQITQETSTYIINRMKPHLNDNQMMILEYALDEINRDSKLNPELTSEELLDKYLKCREIEGYAERTLSVYRITINCLLKHTDKHVFAMESDDLRQYLTEYKETHNVSNVTLENVRQAIACFFKWLAVEGYIYKDPMEKIHSIKLQRQVKEPYTDEELEIMRDNCRYIRDKAIIDVLASTGIRVGELVRLNIPDINFEERECVVLGKGNKERIVYFDAKAKLHLLEYLKTRMDNNPALFVNLNSPHDRVRNECIERMLRELGRECGVKNAHPHKFRRTMATSAIDRGMPIEQVKSLLGHARIDTTMRYTTVKQSGLKSAHRKYLG